MSELEKPNSSQAQEGSLAGQLKGALTKWLREEVDDMLPARVVSYDEQTNRAVIQPLVMVGTTSGAKVSRASLPNIPVFRFGSGQFFMRFPIKEGDFGWLKANDRDLSLILQSQGRQEDWPNTERLHDFSDSMFFPDCVRGWLIDGANVNAAVWQSLDGSVCISLHDDEVNIKAPNLVAQIGTKTTITSPTIELNGQTTINGNTVINGTTGLNGGVAAAGGAMTHNGVNVGSTHTHGGVDTGPSNTGGPQ